MRLIRPTLAELPAYLDALERGWHAEDQTTQGPAIDEWLAIHADPERFLAAHDNDRGRGTPIALADGTVIEQPALRGGMGASQRPGTPMPRLPSIRRWIWDGEFCGVVGFRWQRGTERLPAHVLGHIGYAVVPWKRQAGCATWGLRSMLLEAQWRHLAYVEISTSPHNLASRRVIERNAGVVVDAFVTPRALGAEPALRYRVALVPASGRLEQRRTQRGAATWPA